MTYFWSDAQEGGATDAGRVWGHCCIRQYTEKEEMPLK